MAKDIEEFLRRAAERKRQQQSGQSQPAARREPSQRPSPRRRPPQEPIIIEDVEIVEESPSLRESVRDHVKNHIDTSDIGRHAESLGAEIGAAYSSADARVHQHLDHDITGLDDNPTITDDPPPAIVGQSRSQMAKRVRQMLANPQSAGQAIIVAEILKRPNFD